MDVRVVDHPLAKARLSTMRDARTDNATFRAALRDLTLMLIYEATRDAPVVSAPLHTPVARTVGYRLAEPAAAGAGAAGRAGHGRRRAGADAGGADGLRRGGPRRGRPTSRCPTCSRCPSRWPGGRSSCSTRCWPPAARWSTRSGCSPSAARRDVTAICVLAAPEGIERLARQRAAGAGGDRERRRAAQRLRLHRARPGRRRGPPVRRGLKPPPRHRTRRRWPRCR